MHHKFFVFADVVRVKEKWAGADYREYFLPRAVWTGSFNPTFNGTQSRENAVYIESPKIAYEYMREFYRMLAISEPLDWTSEWVEPEYRFGS